MQDEQFYRKKQLLARRDLILEEIGQTLFDEGGEHLEGQFSGLTKEFRGIDILLRKLKERDRLFREDREQTSQTLRDILEEMAQLDKAFKRDMQPLRHEHDECVLRLGYQKDSLSKKQVCSDMADLEPRLQAIVEEMERCENEHASLRQVLQDQGAPLERKLHRMDKALTEVQDEVQGLLSTRRKRLQDLGFWLYEHKPDMLGLNGKFSQLKTVRLELSESGGANNLEQLPDLSRPVKLTKKREWPQGSGTLLLIIGALLLAFVFQTRYRSETVPLAAIAKSYLKGGDSIRLYANLDQMPLGMVEGQLPELVSLPGGPETMVGLNYADVTQVVLARKGAPKEVPLFFGAVFRKPISGFASGLYHQGWVYDLPIQGWKTMKHKGWIWVILSNHAVVLIPEANRSEFEQLSFGPSSAALFLAQNFGKEKCGVLDRYEGLILELGNREFRLELVGKEALADLVLVGEEESSTGLVDDEPTLKLANNRLLLAGPREMLMVSPMIPTDLVRLVESYFVRQVNSPILP